MAPADQAEGLIGRRIPRGETTRLLRGRGRYVGDITLPRSARRPVWRAMAASR